MQANHQSISDLVSIVVADIDTSEREATTNSLLVAKRFKKHHRDVLRAIRNLGCSKEFRLRNFAQSSFINEQGKTYPCYRYDSLNNVAYEIDEPAHRHNLEKDAKRQKNIEEVLRCKFVRISL